ncbi:MAG: SurA N-terminal domain-containing protein [Nitrospiraceae bacterium]
MIKLLRDVNHEHPWVIKTIMLTLAAAFVITMGWWGFNEQSTDAIATVGDMRVSQDEFRRVYENAYRYYRENTQGEVKDETVKQMVIENLVDSRLWTTVAHQMGLTVSADDLRESILNRPDFQKDGKFDPDLYKRILSANRLTPASFEAMQASDLLAAKARLMVRDSVALTPAEVAEAQSLSARQSQAGAAKDQSQESLVRDFLAQKQQRALAAYTEELKKSIQVKVKKELL